MQRFIVLVFAACARLVFALDNCDGPPPSPDSKETLPGHSDHGEAFNEGPRSAAYLMQGTGKISFPITTNSSLAQKFFTQGVGQLHGFWYFESERSFRQVAALDPECAMSYWGMAMSNINNAKRAREFIKTAVAKKKTASKREQMWIDALADFYKDEKRAEKDRGRDLVRNLEKIVAEYPKDVEAKAFLAGQIWWNSTKGGGMSSHQAVESLINEVLRAEPTHPVHHYRIHLWNGESDKRALESAARCGQSAPGIAHMWHMPGHTFSSLKRYADAAWQQEASHRTDHAYMIHDRVLPDQIHNYAHNAEWLIRDLSFIGRVHDAIELARNQIELPRHPKYNTLGKVAENTTYSGSSNSSQYGRTRLIELLQRYELWDDALDLANTVYLEPTDIAEEQIKRLRLLGVAHFNLKHAAQGAEQIAELEGMLKHCEEHKKEAVEKAEKKGKADKLADDKLKKAMTDAEGPFKSRKDKIEEAIAELKVYQLFCDKKLDAAKEALGKLKGMSRNVQARLYFECGDGEKAVQLAKDAAKDTQKEVQPLANYVDLLFRADKRDDARKEFEKLREISADIDIDIPVFRRLQAAAQAFGYSSDWRISHKKLDDVGKRPDLNKLGPACWHPPVSPSFSVPDANGVHHSLSEYRGKPVIVIFYLGHRCEHCIQQLNAFAPMAKEFEAAGISIVAVSSDDMASLKAVNSKAKLGSAFPFPLLSDSSLNAFKTFRCFDDFEKKPLHGTFLVDSNGLMRWQDISYDPFLEPKFLLKEAKRLLSIPN